MAQDNTVRYHWRVLQLLPSKDRPSYVGLRVTVLERPDGELIVQYEGHTVATQEPPRRMDALFCQWRRQRTTAVSKGSESVPLCVQHKCHLSSITTTVGMVG